MSTIAYRDGILASDSLVTDGDRREGFMRKLFRLADNRMVGFVGDAGYMEQFLAWVDGRGPCPDHEDGRTMEALIIAPSGAMTWVDNCGRRLAFDANYAALGSGAAYAYGALAFGASAEDAVRAAIVHDVHSGGTIVTMSLEQQGRAE